MERQDLYETLQNLYGQLNPIVAEIVQEYADPCYLFNISFEYTNRNDGCFNDVVHIRFEIPVSKVPHAMTTPEGTKVIPDKRCFECVKYEGNYRVTLFVPYPGQELSEISNSSDVSDSLIFTIELMKKCGEGGYAIPLLTERKLNTYGEPFIANVDTAHSTVIRTGNLGIVVRKGMNVYGLDDQSMDYLLNHDITYLARFAEILGF